MTRKASLMLVLPVACLTILVATTTASAQIPKTTVSDCEAKLSDLLLNKRLIAKVGFPAWSGGIDLSLDGKWNSKFNQVTLKSKGIGVVVDESAAVTAVRLKEKVLEIHLNGGGFGTFSDNMKTSPYQQQTRAMQEKPSGGSRLNLKITRPITCADLSNAANLIAWLSPVLDASVLNSAAALQRLAPEWAEAAAQKRVDVGMDKATVFAIMGEPKQKHVDVAVDPPIEKWQYELPNLKTRVVTFKDGKVAKVDEF